MNRRILALTFKVSLVVLSLAVLAGASHMTTIFQKIARIDESGLAQAIEGPAIFAFDLSPTGDSVALLLGSRGPGTKALSWLVIADAKSGRVLRKINTGDLAPYWKLLAYFPPQVSFTPDAKLLVVREQGQVRIVDAATLSTVGTIKAPITMTPVSICGSGRSDVFAISFARDWERKSELKELPVQVEIIDVSDGSQRGTWDADDIPQSLSPEGRLAAVSDWKIGGPLLKLDVVDTTSGKRLAVLDGGFKFEKQEAGGTVGRVVAKFLSEDEILLSPDSKFDRSGRHSGDSLRVATIPDGKIVQELKPDRFGPTGEIGTSADGMTIVAASSYLKPSFFTHPHQPPPADSAPKLFVFSHKQGFHAEGIIKSAGGGLRVGGPTLAFRIASNGSVIAVAEDRGITVLERRE